MSAATDSRPLNQGKGTSTDAAAPENTADEKRPDRPAATAGMAASTSARRSAEEPLARGNGAAALPVQAKPSVERPEASERAGTDLNSMRSAERAAEKRRAIPPLEDRFNVKRIGLVEKAYHFRDQAGKVAFTDKFISISTATESPAAIKAMVDRAAERGWSAVKLQGSPEFVRQGWIAATAQGLKAVGHTPSDADRDAAVKERARLQVVQNAPSPHRPGEAIQRVLSAHVEGVRGDQGRPELGAQRLLAAAIEKAIVDGRVSPELRGQVRAMMTAEGAKRTASGERFRVPVYDALAPRARAKSVQAGPQRQGDRERAR